MRKFLKILLFLFVLIIILIGIPSTIFLINANAFREAQDIIPEVCEEINISEGSAEDIQIDRQNRLALLSVMDRRSTIEGIKVQGTVLGIQLDSGNQKPITILSNKPEDFRPHGLSLYTSDQGLQSLFVINHSTLNGERVELFERNTDEPLFSYVKSFESEEFIKLNDLVAVDSRKFYVVNDTGALNSIERALEMMFSVGMSALVYFDGNNFISPVKDLRSSAGINVSLEKNELYIGETLGKSIRIYDLNNDLSLGILKDIIDLDGGVDNIDIDEKNKIWVANHINSISLIKHFINKEEYAPTQIQRISRDDSQNKIDTFFENDGSLISAGSVGVYDKNSLIIGSITEKKVLKCTLTFWD